MLESSEAYSRERMAEYLHWLVVHAVSLEYEENGETLNREAGEALAKSKVDSGDSSSTICSDIPVPASAAAIIEELGQLCHVSAVGKSPFEVLQAVGRALRQRLLPALLASDAALQEEEEKGAGSKTGSGGASGGSEKVVAALAKAAKDPTSSLATFSGGTLPLPGVRRAARRFLKGGSGMGGAGTAGDALGVRADLSDFPLGFNTGKEIVDYAAALLRMLYIADLRELQDAVNAILITVQEFTADPKTDSALGKVGR